MHATQDPTADRFQFQCQLFESGLQEVQTQIRSLEEILFKLKTGAVTLWAVLVGWAFSSGLEKLLPLGFAIVIAFWLLEGLFRVNHLRAIARSRELASFANDADALDACFATRTFPEGIVYPVARRDSELRDLGRFAIGLFSGTVLPIYLMLALATTVVWLAVPLVMGEPPLVQP